MAKRKPGGKHDKGRVTAGRVQANQDRPAEPPGVPDREERDDDPIEPDGLKPRHRLFVQAFVGPAGGNATRAARMAGYNDSHNGSLRVTAHRVLTNANVQAAIALHYAKLRDTPEWARASLVDLASSSMANFVTVDEKGEARMDFRKAADAAALGQIKEYREEGLVAGGETVAVVKRTIKIHDRRSALETLLKMHGLLTDNVTNVTVNVPVKVLRGVTMDEI